MPDERIEIRDSKGKHLRTYYRNTDQVIVEPTKFPWWILVVLAFGALIVIFEDQKPKPQQSGSSVSQVSTDLSDTYGIVRGTVFNKKTHVVFQTPQEFFAESGQTSFEGLKLDTRARFPSDGRYVNGQGAKRP